MLYLYIIIVIHIRYQARDSKSHTIHCQRYISLIVKLKYQSIFSLQYCSQEMSSPLFRNNIHVSSATWSLFSLNTDRMPKEQSNSNKKSSYFRPTNVLVAPVLLRLTPHFQHRRRPIINFYQNFFFLIVFCRLYFSINRWQFKVSHFCFN